MYIVYVYKRFLFETLSKETIHEKHSTEFLTLEILTTICFHIVIDKLCVYI